MDHQQVNGSTDNHGLTTLEIGLIAGGCGLALVMVILVVLCCWCRKRNRSHVTEPTNENIKLPTLGTHYRIASIPSVRGSITSDRKFSLSSDRKLSGASAKEQESLLNGGGVIQWNPEDSNGSSSIQGQPVPMERDEDALNTDHNSLYVKNVSQGQQHLEVPGRNRSGSTYLDFSGPVNGYLSRKASTTSQTLTMQEIARHSRGIIHTSSPDTSPPIPAKRHSSNIAPLAREESLASLTSSVASMDRGNDKYHNEFGRFIPKLPPKKRRFHHYKSAADVMTESIAEEGQGTLEAAGAKSSLSKSESDLLDYDDLPPECIPRIPSKKRPKLPPKQKINKSQEDFVRLENQFKTSLAELKMADRDLDYDDLPEDKTDDGFDEVDHSNDLKKIKNGATADHEFEDYDEPIHHSLA